MRNHGVAASAKSISLTLAFLFALSSMLILVSCPVEATVIGANKGVLNYENVLKNGYSQELVTLNTDTDFNLSVDYRLEGDIADWVRIEPVTRPFYISRNEPMTLTVIIEPPGDARIDKYAGSIRFITGALGGPDAAFGTSVRTAINLKLGVQVTGQEIVSCRLPEVYMDDVEEGYPLEFYAVFSNRGNVRLTPEFILEFWNQDQTKIVETLTFTADESVLPTVQRRLFKSLPNNLSIGQYWVRITTPVCGDSGSAFITMSVIERGGVSDKGVLVDIENPTDAEVGDIVPIDAVFTNLGTRIVSAKFKGTITSGSKDNIFKVIDTEPIDVMPGQTERLRTYFNPTQEGQYMIAGRVLYNRKLTFERSSVINIFPAGTLKEASFMSLSVIIIMALILIIIIFVFLIAKKRRKRRRI
ncbi:hypothetical protein JW826_06580 [Candidatus Woesearchaeota archaeon]|nr:hypothetical protein [Candidatus Woesearchaeota archaeon]